jgi:hypothetical protein
MAIFLIVRAVSNRFVEVAKANAEVAASLFDEGAAPPEWNVNAVRDHARRRESLAKAGISFDTDAADVHDLDRAWDGLDRTVAVLGAAEANILRVGTAVGDEADGTRVLTSAEASAALASLARVDRASVEHAVRRVLEASRSGNQSPTNPFAPDKVGLYGVGSATDDEVVSWLADAIDGLRDILGDAVNRGFGLAVQVVL